MLTKAMTKIENVIGQPLTFLSVSGLMSAWLIVYITLGYPDWLLNVINTPTNTISFLLLFLLQYGQSRGNVATHAKLDEIIRATKDARNEFRKIEDLTIEEIEERRKDDETTQSNAPG